MVIDSAVLRDALALALAAVFLLAAARKLFDPAPTHRFLHASGLINQQAVPAAFRGLVAAEVLTGALLLAGGGRVAGAMVAGLFLLFSVATFISHRLAVPCGCGITSEGANRRGLARRLLPRAAGLAGGVILAGGPGVPWLRVPSTPAIVAVGVPMLALGVMVLHRSNKQQPTINLRRAEVGLPALSRRDVVMGGLASLGVLVALPGWRRPAVAEVPDALCNAYFTACNICAAEAMLACSAFVCGGNPWCIGLKCVPSVGIIASCCSICRGECIASGDTCGSSGYCYTRCFGCWPVCD